MKDYREVGRRLGLSPAQVTKIMGLLNLAADIQERILLGQLVVSEHSLRDVARMDDWEQQRQATRHG